MTVTRDPPNRSIVDARETEVNNMLQKHWGSVRTVKIFREPNTSLGISIVGGKVSKTISKLNKNHIQNILYQFIFLKEKFFLTYFIIH